MKRYKHNLSNYKLTTFDMGRLIPVQVQEILPGDSMRASTRMLIRCSPMLAPVMHPVVARIHHWFIPHRLTWPMLGPGNGWEDFITGGKDGLDDQTVPQQSNVVGAGSLGDYFGLPVSPSGPSTINSLPTRAYNLIWNHFYRDQDLQAELNLANINLQSICWEKDYFTSSRPTPQKGPDVTVPLGTIAPVKGIAPVSTAAYNQANTQVNESDGTQRTYASSIITSNTGGNATHIEENPDLPGYPAIYADLSMATAANVNEWRRAFAMQRYQEARSRYGSRYNEFLRYQGVTPADSRLNRPEYLGGGRAVINFSEVLQTSKSEADNPLGKLGGHGISAVRSRPFVRHFNEHGYMMTLVSVRPKTIYQDGIERTWLRKDKEDFFHKELQQIGQQPITVNEIYANDTNGEDTFGYQDRYSEYKRTPSKVCGDFRSTLDFWHLARKFSQAPALNSSFVQCSPSKRIFAEQTRHSLWCMVDNRVVARRMVRKSGNSRII